MEKEEGFLQTMKVIQEYKKKGGKPARLVEETKEETETVRGTE